MNQVIPEKLEHLINFTPENRQNFQTYSVVRSKELYYQVSTYLIEIANLNKVDYDLVNEFIMLDKSIKNILYRFLSTYEEQIKTMFLENYKILNNEFILKNTNENLFPNIEMFEFLVSWNKKIKVINHGYYENIFSYIKKNIKNFDSFISYEDISLINKLRNKTMHHSIMILDKRAELIKGMKVLYKNLAKDWNQYLINALKDSLDKRTFIKNSEHKKISQIIDEFQLT